MISANRDGILKIACPCCGGAGHAVFAQTVVGGQLRWYRSISCPKAGRIEEDGTGGGPDDLRAELLDRDGTWSVLVESDEKLRALQIMKRSFSLTNAFAMALLRCFPLFSVGTRAEAEWVVAVLGRGGISAEVLTVRYNLKDTSEDELPDLQSARELLAASGIFPAEVVEASRFSDGSMGIMLSKDGALWHLGIEFDPAHTASITAALWALDIKVERGEEPPPATPMIFETSP